MSPELKVKLKGITKQYKQLFPDEWKGVSLQAKEHRNNVEGDYGDLSKTNDIVERPLIMWPETLYGMMRVKLTDGEQKEFFDDLKHTAIIWYTKNDGYELRLTEKV